MVWQKGEMDCGLWTELSASEKFKNDQMLSVSSIFISTYYVSYERDIRNTLTDVKIFNEYLMTIK